MTLIFRSITWILASLTLFLQKSLKIPVRNQKCHSELLRGRFQDTEKKEQFLTKNWHFCTKNEFFFGTLRYFYLNVPKTLSWRMYPHCHFSKNGEEIAFYSIKTFKNEDFGPKRPFWHLKWQFLHPKCWVCFLKI